MLHGTGDREVGVEPNFEANFEANFGLSVAPRWLRRRSPLRRSSDPLPTFVVVAMSFWNERVWRSDKRFAPRLDTRPTVFTQPLFLAHYAIGFLLFGKIYRDAKRWRTRVSFMSIAFFCDIIVTPDRCADTAIL